MGHWALIWHGSSGLAHQDHDCSKIPRKPCNACSSTDFILGPGSQSHFIATFRPFGLTSPAVCKASERKTYLAVSLVHVIPPCKRDWMALVFRRRCFNSSISPQCMSHRCRQKNHGTGRALATESWDIMPPCHDYCVAWNIVNVG